MNKVEYKFDLINEITEQSILGQLADSHFVYGNPAVIESVEVIKVNSVISKIRDRKEYQLNPHRIIVKQNDCKNIIISDEIECETISINKLICCEISENVNLTFLNFLREHSENLKDIKYYNRGIIKNILSNRNPDNLISDISKYTNGYNWIMIPESIFNEISNSKNIELVSNKSKSIIKLVAKLNEINIYVNPLLQNEVYIGKLDSVSSIFNKNLKIENCPHGLYDEGIKITTEYAFIHKNNIRRILVK